MLLCANWPILLLLSSQVKTLVQHLLTKSDVILNACVLACVRVCERACVCEYATVCVCARIIIAEYLQIHRSLIYTEK